MFNTELRKPLAERRCSFWRADQINPYRALIRPDPNGSAKKAHADTMKIHYDARANLRNRSAMGAGKVGPVAR
jgi:hypothetical protein